MNIKTVEVSKKQFEIDYHSMKIKELCNKYGLCTATIYSLVKRFGIKTKRNTDNMSLSKIIYKD